MPRYREAQSTRDETEKLMKMSQKHSGHHDSQTALQAVVTNDQLLAAQFKGSGTPPLVKTCQEDGGKQRLRIRKSGAKVKPGCYNCSCETGPGYLVQARRCLDSAFQGVTRDKEATALDAVCIYISCAVLAAV